MIDNLMIKQFGEIMKYRKILLFSHKNPDGDTLGSAFALKKVLEMQGKCVEVACSDIIPKKYQFISDDNENLDVSANFDPDCVVSVDVATESMFGEKYKHYASVVDINIDHHVTNSLYGKINIIESDYSSVGEILYELISSNGWEINDYIAEKLYISIAFDTGCFRFSNARSNTFRIASELLKFNFQPSEINKRLFDYASLSQLLVENAALQAIKQYKNEQITVVKVTQDLLNNLGVNEDEVDGMTTITRRVAGTLVGIVLRETLAGEIKVSLRSSNDFDVSQVAKQFGGGGHKKAAGCILNCSIEDAEKVLLERIEQSW